MTQGNGYVKVKYTFVARLKKAFEDLNNVNTIINFRSFAF